MAVFMKCVRVLVMFVHTDLDFLKATSGNDGPVQLRRRTCCLFSAHFPCTHPYTCYYFSFFGPESVISIFHSIDSIGLANWVHLEATPIIKGCQCSECKANRDKIERVERATFFKSGVSAMYVASAEACHLRKDNDNAN